MGNPIRNAVKEISKKDLVTCKRCGCPDLAWVQYKSGKWGLVDTAVQRPLWRGDGPAPEGLFALKFNYHRCEEYTKLKAEIERRASECHPKADNPAAIVADACSPIIKEIYSHGAEVGNKIMVDDNHPLRQALELLLNAQSTISNLAGVK
jgi:hypothetical protein